MCSAWLLFAGLSLILAPPALAVGNSPAAPVPADRWGSPNQMRPWAIVGDSTVWSGSTVPNASTPIWHGMDIAGGYLFTATGKGVMVHDLENADDADPTNPRRLGYVYAAISSPVPTWFQSDQKFYLYDIEAPADNHDVAVTVGSSNGVIVWDFSDKTSIDVHYQDYTHGDEQGHNGVWANTIGGRDYAFTAEGSAGFAVYDLTAAQKHFRCDVAKDSKCSDVYKGTFKSGGNINAVDGVGNFLAVGQNVNGVEIWNVANPTAPTRLLAAQPAGYHQYQGVALWKQGAAGYYLAVYDGSRKDGTYYTYVFDVSCIANATCDGSNPLAKPLAKLSSNGYILGLLKVSVSDGRTFLSLGGHDGGSGGDQREFLYDVTDPREPVELTPKNPAGKGYWGWYYEGNFTGDPADGAFEGVAPRAAMVHNGYVYRAAFTLLDVHELLGAAPPTADFAWQPTPVYGGQEITFGDLSSGAPTSWIWQFDGAAPSTTGSFEQNPKVTFSPTGFPATATVTLSAGNDAGSSDPVQKQVTVNDPKPKVGSVTFTPSSPLVCQQLVFTANAVTGRPDPLGYSWVVKDGSGNPVQGVSGNANPFTWQTGESTAPGTYTAEVTVTNGAGSFVKPSAAFTLTDPPQLAIDSGPGTNDFLFGTVQFSSETTGAATWTWDFGDGNAVCPSGFTKSAAGCTTADPSLGENPVYNYTATGTYTATLTVANCKHGEQSSEVQVTVLQIDPLKITTFQARSQCQVGGIGGCFTVGKAIHFDQVVSGTPDSYEYDWNGDGTWESSTAQVTSHTYASAGTFTPKMRILRGGEPPVVVANGCSSEEPTCTGAEIVVAPAAPAAISVSGPSSGSVSQNLSFSASTSNCSPSSDGWSWTAGGGGTVSGSGSSVTISWGSAGSKSVSAKNSSCGNATGTKLVSISAPGGGGGGGNGGLVAAFSFEPTSPTAGQAVSFDASASTGSPTGYSWSFGDGGSATAKIASHTYQEPGSYSVALTVSAPGNCPNAVGAVGGICSHTTTKTVTVSPGNQVSAKFDDGGVCEGGLVGVVVCAVETGEEVTFTDASTGEVTKRTWDFGDGETATGKNVTHSWNAPGSYTVTLTVENEDDSSTASQVYTVNGPALRTLSSVVVPWIARADADKALPQSSDLDVHNPGPEPLTVKLTFRKRGLPEPDPPQVERTIAANGTLHVPDAMTELFDRANNSGFVFVEPVEGSHQPVVTSSNHTFRGDGAIFGQVVPGVRVDGSGAKAGAGSAMTHLVGLNANDERLAYFGISNPNDEPFFYHLRFYDSLGRLVGGTEEPEAIARFGQKQYQSEDLLADFGIAELDDYRIEIVPEEGSPTPFVYGANLRRKSFDPSFVRGGRTDASEMFLVGALNTPGLNDSFFRSDVVLGNTIGDTVLCDLTFTGAGFQTEPTAPITETLQPGESLRMVDVVSEWDVGNAVGALRVACEAPGGVFPVVQGESYDTSKPDEYYGQFMPALTEDDAAVAGSSHTLVGLRKDDQHRTTVWLFNPSDDTVAEYDLLYFDVDGNQLGSETGVRLGRGKFRQINPEAHPLPESVPGGFVVRIDVKSGKLLTAGQVVNRTNDPAYIVGQ